MDSGDVLALIAGIVIVIVVAIIANPHYLSEMQHNPDSPAIPKETEEKTFLPDTIQPEGPEQIRVMTPVLPKSDVLPYRILFSENPFSYPVYKLPEHLVTTGASDILSPSQVWVPFAFMENTRGGVTRVFSVPYPVWVINSTVVSENQPQYTNFRMALCYADTGGLIKGEEILYPGSSYRIVRTANTRMYMIISVKDIDRYYIRLETPKEYYDSYRSDGMFD